MDGAFCFIGLAILIIGIVFFSLGFGLGAILINIIFLITKLIDIIKRPFIASRIKKKGVNSVE